jgi:hypothetical protein
LQEQQGQPEHWLGAKTPDAVFIRLQHSGGVVTSTVDAELALLQQESEEGGGGQDNGTLVVIKWWGSSSSVSNTLVTKVSADRQRSFQWRPHPHSISPY